MIASLETIRFPVAGMTCSACVHHITKAVRRLEGVERVRVDLGRGDVTVRRDAALAPDAALVAAIADAGYAANLDAATPAADADLRGPLARLFGR